MANLDQYNKERQELIDVRRQKAGSNAQQVVHTHAYAKPKTLKQKISNIWYHYKMIIFGILFVLIVFTVWLVNALQQPVYDATFLILSERSFSGAETLISTGLKSFVSDAAQNGEILLDIETFDLISENDTEISPQMQEMTTAKAIGRVSTRKDFVFMLDETGYENLKSIGMEFEDISSFTGSDTPQGDKYSLKGTRLSEKMELNAALNDMFLCFADFDSYSDNLQNDTEMQELHESQRSFFQAMIDYQ